MSLSIRQKGLLKFVLLGSVAAGIAFAIYWVQANYRHSPHGELLIILALPGAWAIIGLIEAVSGRPFAEFRGMWDELSGWQRGIFGLAVAAVAFVVFLALVVFGIGADNQYR